MKGTADISVLPAVFMSYSIDYSYISDVGKRRSANQDNFCILGSHMDAGQIGTEKIISGSIQPAKPVLFSVFDGMGGEERGEMASYIAAKKAAETAFGGDIPNKLYSFCKNANREICGFAEENGIRSTGTTAAMLVFEDNLVHMCNIGDSKVFLLREGALTQISEDHLAPVPPGKKAPLSQSLGIPEDEMTIVPCVRSYEIQENDVFIISSDGLTDMVPQEQIAAYAAHPDTGEAAKSLVSAALANGGRDNVTVVVCRIAGKPGPVGANKALAYTLYCLVAALAIAVGVLAFIYFRDNVGNGNNSGKPKTRETQLVSEDSEKITNISDTTSFE